MVPLSHENIVKLAEQIEYSKKKAIRKKQSKTGSQRLESILSPP